MEEEAKKILESNRCFDYFAAFPTGVPFIENMETIQTIKAYSALAMAYAGLGQIGEMKKAIDALRHYSVDTQLVDLICGEAQERAANL